MTVTEPEGAVPATEQEPGAFEVAGGAAEALGGAEGAPAATSADEGAAGA